MEIINDNGILKIFDNENLLYTAKDSADADQFIITYIPITSNIVDSSNNDFIPA